MQMPRIPSSPMRGKMLGCIVWVRSASLMTGAISLRQKSRTIRAIRRCSSLRLKFKALSPRSYEFGKIAQCRRDLAGCGHQCRDDLAHKPFEVDVKGVASDVCG